jgi:hypothetical protein
VWGWGQLAAGDRRGWLGPPAQAVALAGLVVAAPYAAGTGAPLVYLLAAGVAVAWILVPVHAWHRAARRRAALDAPAGGGGADLLWLTPLALVVGAGFWIAAGDGADAPSALDAYLADWRAGRVEAAAARLVDSPEAAVLRSAWDRQEAALRNAVVRVVAAQPAAEADVARPLEGVRWIAEAGRGGSFVAEIARQETVRGEVLGFLPTTSRRLVPVEVLGGAELRLVEVGRGVFGPVTAWRIVSLDLAGEATGD